MSRLYQALRRLEHDIPKQPGSLPDTFRPTQIMDSVLESQQGIEGTQTARIDTSPESHLVAQHDPRSLGAEKFRALATRLENIRDQREFKSLQVTSSTIGEGKSLVAVNLALTLASSTHGKTLLVEGDLHKPTLASLLGLTQVSGVSQWWSSGRRDFVSFLCRLDEMPLWFLGAGGIHEQPSAVLKSPRFAEAFAMISAQFDWVIVDSTPMLPVADANLWSRLVDGTLLVVREGMASPRVLKKGLESLDNLKLLGVVLNEASELSRPDYKYSSSYSK